MADENVRHAERNFVTSNDYSSYCRYVTELRRHLATPHFETTMLGIQGAAHGWVPAATHLLAPWNTTRIPRFWSPSLQAADPCLPSRGILGWIIGAIFDYLPALSPRRCTCGGEARGHAPNCEIVIGTGDVSEELHGMLQQWFDGNSTPNLLDQYLEHRPAGVYGFLMEDEYTLTDLMNTLNVRLGWHYVVTAAMNNNVLNFYLQDWGPARLAPAHPWSSFEFHLNSHDQCEIQLAVRTSATVVNTSQLYTGTGAALSAEIAQRISDIPTLLSEYSVWLPGPYPLQQIIPG